MLDLILSNKEGLVGNVKLKGSLGCSGCQMVQFRMLSAARREHSNLTYLGFRKADLASLGISFVESHGTKPFRKEGPKKIKLLGLHGSPLPSCGGFTWVGS